MEVIIPLHNTKLCVRDKENFVIIQPNGESHTFTGIDSKSSKYWVKKLEDISLNAGRLVASSSVDELLQVQFRCNFSNQVILKGESQKRQTFQGGLLSDIVDFVFVHCICESDFNGDASLMESLMNCFPVYCTTEEIIEVILSVIKKYQQKAIKTRSSKSKKLWQSRFKEFGKQLTAAYCPLTIDQRKIILDFCNSLLPTEHQIHLLSFYPSLPDGFSTDIKLEDLEDNHLLPLNPQWEQSKPSDVLSKDTQ